MPAAVLKVTRKEGAMTLTMWRDPVTGGYLERDLLEQLRARARRLYEANRHIFEDEVDALSALGVVPLLADDVHEGLDPLTWAAG
jgi:hypothetical protein